MTSNPPVATSVEVLSEPVKAVTREQWLVAKVLFEPIAEEKTA